MENVKSKKGNAILCWLATADRAGQPSVSPKEVWTFRDEHNLIIANIASPNSIKNIQANPLVSVSFIDIFIQKGKKMKGMASILQEGDPNFKNSYELLFDIAGEDYPFSSIINVDIQNTAPIVAPSYFLKPEEELPTKIKNAMNTYGVQPIEK